MAQGVAIASLVRLYVCLLFGFEFMIPSASMNTVTHQEVQEEPA